MPTRKHHSHLRIPIFVFALLIIVSGVMLALSSGGFIVNFKTLGFTALSTLQKGVKTVYESVTGTIAAVNEIRVLRQEYEKLTELINERALELDLHNPENYFKDCFMF